MIESRKIHKKQIADLIVLNDGYRIVTASSGGSVRLWNTSTGSCENMMSFNDGNDCQLTLLRDGRVIAWCNDMDEEDVDSEVLLWDPKANDDDVRSIFKASLEFNAVVELSDGRILAAVGFSLQIWDPMHSDSDAFDGDFEIHKLWTFDDGRLIVADSTDCLSVYQSLDQLLGEAGNQPIVSYPINCAVSCIACRRDSSDIYAGLENGEVLFLKAESPL
ncbi:MAG: WD40 repeat domain-containing protein [Planctomycetes bacterium]|nr:WD40 repeat domain-containing protein [Planctomycetota bacterium]